MQRIGFIGLGAMGGPMAGNVQKAGFPLSVWARRRESADSIVRDGATWADSPRELARTSDIVITIVTNSPDVEEIVTGPDGLLEGNHDKMAIVDMSTIAPSTSRELARLCRQRNVHFVDAPVSGGTQGAENATLSIMAGGTEEAFASVKPVLQAMGTRIFHVGPAGTGSVVKLMNNILVGAIAAATAEALVVGVKAGADVESMAEVVSASTGASWQLSNQFPLRAFNGSFRPGFMTDLLCKDLGLALDLGKEVQVPMYITSLVRQLYGAVQAKGYGRDDYTSILRELESAAGISVRTNPGGAANT